MLIEYILSIQIKELIMLSIKIIADILKVNLINSSCGNFIIANLLVSCSENNENNFNLQIPMDANTAEYLIDVENKLISGQRIILDDLYLATQIEAEENGVATLRLNKSERLMNNIQFVSEINKQHFPCSLTANMVARAAKNSVFKDEYVELSVLDIIYFGLSTTTNEPVEIVNHYNVKIAIDGTSSQLDKCPINKMDKVVLRNMKIKQQKPIELNGKYHHQINFLLHDPIDNLGVEQNKQK